MSARRLAALAATALFATSPSACSVAALQGAEYNGPKNTCNAGCADGATCIDGQCRAAKTAYKMVIEITPPSTAYYASDVTFSMDELGGGTGGDHELRLPLLAQVTMTVDATGLAGAAGTKGIPLGMRLVRVGSLPGLAQGTFEARSAQGTSLVPGRGSVSIAVPPGTYDVYLAPLEPDMLAVVPPLVLGAINFASGPQERVLVVGAVKSFDLNVTDEEGKASLTEAVDGYDVSVVDRVSGRLVSTVDRTCTHPAKAHVLLSPGLDQHTYSVRFSPPKEKCDPSTDPPLRPTYDFDLDALNVDGSGIGTVAMPRVSTISTGDAKSAPVTVSVGGTVKKGETPIQSSLVFRSRKLSIPTTWKTGTSFYETSGSSIADAFGTIINLQLPAGQYDVQIVPSQTDAISNPSAVTIAERRDLTATNNYLALSVGAKTNVRGSAAASDGGVFSLGTVDLISANSSAIPVGSLFARLARSKSLALARPVNPTDPSFSTTVDPGTYDLVISIPEASGYPWLVRPRLEVATPTAEAPRVDLQKLYAVAPVVLTGKVLDPNGDPVARATVRARAKLFEGDPETTAALRGVVVGETKSEEDGSYVLVVPSDFVKTATR